jgi:hypothetical protein
MNHTNARYLITATCDTGHRQSVTTEGLSLTEAETAAGLIDGSSIFYRIRPRDGDERIIGRCSVCGKPFRCKVERAE